VTGFVSAGDANWWVTAVEEHSRFGESVASAGNVDGRDGDDLLVGAPKDGSVDGGGVAYLYLSTGGGVGTTYAWRGSSGKDGASFGSAVASAGDVNGDGLDDAIIGAVDYKTLLEINGVDKEVKAGGAFVYAGVAGQGLSVDPIWSYAGTVQEGEFAYSVAGAGDVNGDGIDDIVVGARSYTDDEDGERFEGAVYVFFGHEFDVPSPEPDWFLDSDQAGAWLGASVGAAGDVNDDGYDDLIVGAPKYMNPETGENEGAVLLIFGGSSPTIGWIAYGGQDGARFGHSIAGAGDVNGDGYADIVVSAPGYLRPSDDAQVGAAFAFCGNGTTYGADPCWLVYGGQPGGGFGASVGVAGDVNGDNYDEVIVGAPTYLADPDSGLEGAVFLYFGSKPGLSTFAGWKAGGNRAKTDFGWSVGSAGDINGNGSDGVLIGAPQQFEGGTAHGAAFAFYGPIEPADMYQTFLPLVVR
jgi:hypothetical protein